MKTILANLSACVALMACHSCAHARPVADTEIGGHIVLLPDAPCLGNSGYQYMVFDAAGNSVTGGCYFQHGDVIVARDSYSHAQIRWPVRAFHEYRK
jgi:hypothetical protein